MSAEFEAVEPLREQIDAFAAPLVVEFGAPWCSYCINAQPLVEAALAEHANVQHLRVEDGPGRRLGRSFGVKLWPTLIFMRGGAEVSRLVRPHKADEIRQALAAIAGQGG